MSAVETTGTPVLNGLLPPGSPVESGRVHLGRLRPQLPAGRVTVLVGFASLGWLGDPEAATPPDLGRMVYRSDVSADRRGRVVLDRRARAWLAVADAASFDALVMPSPAGGVLVVPVEDFGRRISEVTS